MRHLKQRKKWFLSYVCIFLVCSATGWGVTVFSQRILMRQIEETMNVAFDNSVSSVQNKLEDQQINMYMVLESNGVTALSNKYLDFDRRTELEFIRQIMDTMSIQYVNTECTDDNLICFRDTGVVVGMNDSFTNEQAYANWFSEIYGCKDDLYNDFFSLNNMIKFRAYHDASGHQKIAVIQKRLGSIGAVPSVVAVSLIDVQKLFGEMYDNPLYEMFLFSGEEQICTSREGSVYEVSDGSGITVSFEGDEHIQYSRDVSGLRYVQIFNNGKYTERLSIVRNVGIIINLAVLILGVFISVFFTRINYRPISRMKSRLKIEPFDENEYVAIENGIENILRDRTNINRQLRKKDELLYETCNKMLISVSAGDDIELIAENLKMSFSYEHFLLLNFFVDEIGNVARDTDTLKQNMEIASFCIINVFREVLPERVTCDFCTVGNNCCCIINFAEKSGMDAIMDGAFKACDFLKKNFDMELVYFASESGKLSDIPQMREQLDLISVFHGQLDETGFCYGRYFEYMKGVYDNYYRGELIQSVKYGDVSETMQLVNRFISIVMKYNAAAEDYKKFFADTLLKTYCRINDKYDIDDFLRTENKKENDAEGIKSALIRLFKTSATVNRQSEGAEDEKVRAVIEFVKQNYGNEDLNVSYISEKMGMSISGLSRFFKNHTNEGLAEYILRYRCKKAAELLDERHGMTIAEVGQHCGFCSTISFIRAFKRIYGTTPGKYNNKTVI